MIVESEANEGIQMPTLSVRLFGKFNVCRDREPVQTLDVHKIQEFFSYLLVFRARPHQREALAGLFWGESDTSQSRKNLRQVLWQLQSALSLEVGAQDPPLLLVEPEWVQVNPLGDLWLDVDEFEKIAAQALGTCGSHLESEQVDRLRLAVNLYTGDLLEGWYQDWCLFERERLQNMYLVMLDKLIDHCELTGDCDSGLDYGARILRYDRARERTHYQLMRLHCMDGNRTDALRQYERCVMALKEELNVVPCQEVTDLYLQIKAGLAGRPVALRPAPAHPRNGQPETRQDVLSGQDVSHLDSAYDLIAYLTRLQGELAVASRLIQEEILTLQHSSGH